MATRVPAPTLALEHELLSHHSGAVVGLDEVGRGCVAGPICVGAVAVEAGTGGPPHGLHDSKLLTAHRRQALVPAVEAWAAGTALGWASVAEIDELGVTGALALASGRALGELRSLGTSVGAVVCDGNRSLLVEQGLAIVTVVGADRTCASVAAASVLAKVRRDALMASLDDEAHGYGFARNAGYLTAEHAAALRQHGRSIHHRRTFRLAVLGE